MRLLLDQGLPRTAGTELAKLGWDVVHVGDVGLASAGDREILQRALTGPELAALIQRVVHVCEADLRAGAMVTADESGVRVRGLPVIR